jgi:hypothetical protein
MKNVIGFSAKYYGTLSQRAKIARVARESVLFWTAFTFSGYALAAALDQGWALRHMCLLRPVTWQWSPWALALLSGETTAENNMLCVLY